VGRVSDDYEEFTLDGIRYRVLSREPGVWVCANGREIPVTVTRVEPA
jgi:hypothetical protein